MRSNLGIKSWDDRWFAFISFAFLFWKEKYGKEKKQIVQDLIPPFSMYIHMCTLYAYTNIWMPTSSPSGFFGPSWCLISTPRLTSKYLICAVCVCVCVRIHTHLSTYTSTRIRNREGTDNTPIVSSVKNNPPRQATSAFNQAEPERER